MSDAGASLSRRVFIAAALLGGSGVIYGPQIQRAISDILGGGTSGLASYLPGGDRFRIYTVTSGYPDILYSNYSLRVSGMVENPMLLNLDSISRLPQQEVVADFQCVTGWRVPKVVWRGVSLKDLLTLARPKSSVKGLEFLSFDGTYTESLDISQAETQGVLVATHMFDKPLSRPHGGPVRLYVPQMYGYKSIKWLSEIRAVEVTTPGYWEQAGYPVDGYSPDANIKIS